MKILVNLFGFKLVSIYLSCINLTEGCETLTKLSKMTNLKQALLEQKERKGNGCGTYGISAADIRENSSNEVLAHADADYFIRIMCKTKSGILNHSNKNAKKEFFAVKDGQVFKTDFFAPDGRYLKTGQWSWDMTDHEAERPMQEIFSAYSAACTKYHNENPTDSRNEYDCFCWFKGTNIVIVAPNYSEMRGQFPKNAKRIIRNYSEV